MRLSSARSRQLKVGPVLLKILTISGGGVRNTNSQQRAEHHEDIAFGVAQRDSSKLPIASKGHGVTSDIYYLPQDTYGMSPRATKTDACLVRHESIVTPAASMQLLFSIVRPYYTYKRNDSFRQI